MSEEHPLYPLMQIAPLINEKIKKKLPYSLDISLGETLTFNNLYDAAEKVCDKNKGNYEWEVSEAV